MNNRFVKLLDPNYAAQMNNGTQAGGLAYLASQLTQGLEMGRKRKEEETAKQNDQAAIDRFISGFQGQTQMRDGGGSTPAMAPGGYSNAQGGYAGALDALKGVEGPRARELMLTALQGQQQTQAQRAEQARADRQRQEDIERQNKQWEASYGLDQRRVDLASQPKQTPVTYGAPVSVVDQQTGQPVLVQYGNDGSVNRVDGYGPAQEQKPMFEGTGMDAQDRNTLIAYTQAAQSGKPIDQQMQMAAKLAYGRLSSGRNQNMPDGSVIYIPGADLAGMGFANPNQPAPQPVNGIPSFDPKMISGKQAPPLSPQAQTVFDEGKQVIDGVPVQSGNPSLEALLAVQERNQQQGAPFMQQQAPQPMPQQAAQQQQADAIPGVPGSRIIAGGDDKNKMKLSQNVAQVQSTLDEYTKAVENYGLTPFAGENQGRLKALHTDLMMQYKNLYELGALQQPDIEILNELIPNVTEWETLISSGALYGQGKATVVAQLKEAKRLLSQKLSVAGVGQSQAQPQTQNTEDPLGILGGGMPSGQLGN